MKQKRTEPVKAHITPELREQLELFKGNVVSMSDYLFEVLQHHVAVESAMRRPSMRVSQQRFSRKGMESTG